MLQRAPEHRFLLVVHESQAEEFPGAELIVVPPGSPLAELLWVETELPKQLERWAADLYHSLKQLGPLRGVRRPYILSLNEVGQYFARRTLPWKEHAYWRYLQPIALRRADRVVAATEWTAAFARTRLHLPAAKLSIVSRGIDDIYWADPERSPAGSEPSGLPHRYVLCVGNMNPKKNFGTVVRALARLRSEGTDVPDLLIAGAAAGYRAADLDHLIRRLGMAPNVHRVGFVGPARLAPLYRRAELLVYPSLYEAFGIPPIEAMACGCPVVASKRGAIPEVTGGHAWYVDDPMNPVELAGAIQLALSEGRSSPRVEDARRWVRRYSWDGAAEAALKVYEQLLASWPNPQAASSSPASRPVVEHEA
jgi:glycosyltransferase involved in cell wall biosynthesis